jgi:hypothetical protein
VIRPAAFLAGALALAACGEDPQVANRVKQDSAVYQGTGMPYQAAGWKPGDRNSWEQHLKVRTQNGQNEYVKTN